MNQVHSLISSISRHKLLVLTGQSLEETGDLVLHTGQFTPNDFTQILSEEEVGLNAFDKLFVLVQSSYNSSFPTSLN